MSTVPECPSSEDQMDLGPFLQNYVLKNPFTSLITAGKAVPHKLSTDLSRRTRGIRGRHRYTASIRVLLSGGSAQGGETRPDVDTDNEKIKTSPSATQIFDGDDEKLSLVSDSVVDEAKTRTTEGGPASESVGGHVGSNPAYALSIVAGQNGTKEAAAVDKEGLKKWLRTTFKFRSDCLMCMLTQCSVVRAAQVIFPRVSTSLLHRVITEIFPKVVVRAGLKTGANQKIQYRGLIVKPKDVIFNNPSYKSAYEAVEAGILSTQAAAVRFNVTHSTLLNALAWNQVSITPPLCSASSPTLCSYVGKKQTTESVTFTKTVKRKSLSYGNLSDPKRWAGGPDHLTERRTEPLGSLRYITPVSERCRSFQATNDSKDDNVDFEEMLRDISGDVRDQSATPEDISHHSAVTRMDGRHKPVGTPACTSEIKSSDSSNDYRTEETISLNRDACKWSRSGEAMDGVYSSSVSDGDSAMRVDTEGSIGAYDNIYQENDGALNLRIKPEPYVDERNHSETRGSPSNLVLDYRSNVGCEHERKDEVTERKAIDASSKDSKITSLEARLERVSRELAGQVKCNATLRSELTTAQDVNVSLQEDLSNRDFHIVHLADDFFKLHEQFRQLARQFQLALSESRTSVPAPKLNGSLHNGHS